MLTKREFFEALSKTMPGISEGDLANYDAIVAAANELVASMPSIGIFSARKRFSSFIQTCRSLDSIMNDGRLSFNDAACVLVLLRLTNSRFRKAAQWFEAQAPQIGVGDWVALPTTAQLTGAAYSHYGVRDH